MKREIYTYLMDTLNFYFKKIQKKIHNFTEVQVSRVIIVLLLQNCFVWCKDHTHQAMMLLNQLSRALYEIRSTQKTKKIHIYIY